MILNEVWYDNNNYSVENYGLKKNSVLKAEGNIYLTVICLKSYTDTFIVFNLFLIWLFIIFDMLFRKMWEKKMYCLG